MRTKNVLTLAGVALILLLLVVFVGSSFIATVANNTTNNTTLNESINDTVNATVEANNTTTAKKTSTQKSSKTSVSDSKSDVKTSVFTVSEDEKGENEGMEPGKYKMYYTEKDGPIDVEKID